VFPNPALLEQDPAIGAIAGAISSATASRSSNYKTPKVRAFLFLCIFLDLAVDHDLRGFPATIHSHAALLASQQMLRDAASCPVTLRTNLFATCCVAAPDQILSMLLFVVSHQCFLVVTHRL
jgi:hypothetical protein